MKIATFEYWTDSEVKDYIFNSIMDILCLRDLYDFDPEWKVIDRETELIFKEIEDVEFMTLEDLDLHIAGCINEKDLMDRISNL